MASDNARDLFANPLPYVAVALLATGVFVRNIPLESARPADAGAKPAAYAAEQDLQARLWQDPFEVVPRSAERTTLAQKRKRQTDDPLHAPDLLARQVQVLREAGQRVSLVGVLVFGSPYAEDVEYRRRTRYAVLAGLSARGFVPDNPSALGYFRTPIEDEATQVPELVPFEWFTRNGATASSSRELKLKEIPAPAGADGAQRADEKTLLLWLDNDALGRDALLQLSRIAQRLACAPGADDCARGLEPVRIIGPASSSALSAMLEFAAGTKPAPDQVRIQLVSPFATIPNERLANGGEVPAAWEDKLAILRTTGTDDDLARALVEELALRRVNAGARGTACSDGVVLISEWDTDYGRTLPRLIRNAIKDRCGRPAANGGAPDQGRAHVWWFSYLRGLDGSLPGATSAAVKRDARDRKENGGADELIAAPRDRSEGRSQFDYLRRIGERIRKFDEAELGRGRTGVRAIGVLGSDVYDKLLVLQALRPMFPQAVFFTTDLDARLAHPDQNAWARNLVVASHFGLALNSGLQHDIPPFRDSYQTATYFATLVALAPRNKQPGAKQLSEWFSPQRVRADAGSGDGVGAFDYDEAARARHFAGKKLYEVGRTGLVELDENGAGMRARCSRDQLGECRNIHPKRERAVLGPDLAHSEVWLATGGGALGFLLLVLTSHHVRGRWRELVAAAAVVAAVFGALRWLIQVDAQGSDGEYLRPLGFIIVAVGCGASLWLVRLTVASTIQRRLAAGAIVVLGAVLAAGASMLEASPGLGEPIAWLEGVSTWPTEFIRLAAIMLACFLLGRGWVNLRRQADVIQREFFLSPARRELESPCAREPLAAMLRRIATAARSGFPPVADYFHCPDGALVPAQPGARVRVDAMKLWHHYRRRSSFWPCAMRIGTCVALALVAAALVLYLDAPSVPARGDIAFWSHLVLRATSTTLLVVLIFSVVDATRMCTNLIRCLSSWPTLWPHRTRVRFERRYGVPAQFLEASIDFDFIVFATKAVNRFIYYPFAVLLLLIVSRSTVFDAWEFPLPLLTLVACGGLYAIYSALSLRRAAEEARHGILTTLDEECLRLTAGRTPEGVANPKGVADGLKALAERVRATREGAFLPLTQQAAIRALLIPFGGFGGLQILEYLVDLH